MFGNSLCSVIAADTLKHRRISSHRAKPPSVLSALQLAGPKPGMRSYLKFVFDLAGVGLGVQPADVVVERAELAHGDGGVAAEACLQDGIMHEHVLLLQCQGEKD